MDKVFELDKCKSKSTLGSVVLNLHLFLLV